jgi:hypothetical protein
MKALLLIVLVAVLLGGGLRMMGVPLPLIDYRVGPIGIYNGQGPAMPNVQIEPPGFGDFPAAP